MYRTFRLTLLEADARRVLDALRMQEELWERTARYLREDYLDSDEGCVADCGDEWEAAEIHRHYAGIITALEGQIDEQRAPSSPRR
ncbi:MAG TPA: hypothetical protein PKW75_08760 [candidate division Zixibacteria bacterium]|nr:hypothetical protein [candidate division Zixibacteria bacterium]MDD4917773.1 hypothetical protein [candidate division Zixibacteria bacterium]MDM7973722.1 hypothetical protein [candidate division Zixibacteria bacterium]HOZ08363.1 hypothetical protein [candidate division Zixibacteria bacterium]